MKQTLIEVRQLLIDKGWCQHFSENDLGQYCLMGALSIVGDPNDEAYIYLYPLTNYGVSRWNDAPGRTFEEVIALLDKAIAGAQ